MATYTVQSPDGKTITLEGPDGASHEDVIAQAQQLYKPTAAPAAPAKPRPLDPHAAKQAWDGASADLERQISNLPDAAKKIARDKFFNDPRIASLRTASAQPEQSHQRMLDSAQARSAHNVSKTGNFLTALKAGLTRGAFGLPERLAAAGEAYLPASITGNDSNASYDQILDQIRSNTDADLNQSFAGNILGQITSGGLIGGAAAKSLGALAEGTSVGRAAATVARVAPKTTKVASLAAAGAVGGGAQAAGEGSDVSTGAAYGAAGAPALIGLGKAAKWLARPIGDLLGLPSAGNILRRFTNATSEAMHRAAEEFRARTGAEPTLFEILPLADRNKFAKNVIGSSPEVSEQAAAAVRDRVGNVGPELTRTVQQATGDQRGQIIGQMADDLNAARAGPPDAAPLPGVARAAQSPADLKDFQAAESAAHMAPVQNQVVADQVETMFPRTLEHGENGEIKEVYSDPEVNAAIINAAGSMTRRRALDDPSAAVAGITADDATRILRNLAKVQPGTPQKGAAMRAEQVIMDHIEAEFPQAAGQIQKMRDGYAARARMVEGMAEGGRTRTRESIPLTTAGENQKVRNAFETPEGSAGRVLGQTNVLGRDFAGTQRDVLRTAGDIAESGQTQRALASNLGAGPAGAITDAAAAQAQSVRNLAAVGTETGKEADSLGLEDLGRMILALNPSSMPTTKLFALSRLTTLTRMPERKARALVDMLLSQDPATTNRAIGLLNSAGRQAQQFLSDLGKSIALGAQTGQMGQAFEGAGQGPDLAPVPAAAAAETPDVPGMTEPGNIDLHNRPVVHNEDGTISTVRSITVGFDDGIYLIPTVVGGKVVSNDDAIAHFRQTHEHLGKFESEEAADAYAQSLHESQAAEYGGGENNDDGEPYGRSVIEDLFPDVEVTSDHRGPDNAIYDPNSGHAGYNAVDVRPIPGLTFEEFIQAIEESGHTIVHAYDETRGPADRRKAKAWGPHWHVEIG